MSVPVNETLQRLLQQEDTDGDKKITIEDKGPKEFHIEVSGSENIIVKGTYHLSNLLQELVIAKREGRDSLDIDLKKIEEPPVDRVSRMIREYYWDGLTRTMDAKGIERLIKDTKNETLVSDSLRIYVPFQDELAYDYYKSLEDKFPIQTIKLPAEVSPEYVKDINVKPGILALKLSTEGDRTLGAPFVVPGGRFNEMYGWDSYFESVGLLIDGCIKLAIGMADNFQYEIENYGKILNANRSYYLTRTQPPFYSSLIREIFELTRDKDWLSSHLRTAIREYNTVWMVPGKRLTNNGLNRYLAEGIGITPECEEGHYDAIILPYAEKLGINIQEYILKYDSGEIIEPELDLYFLHDRSVRESGHDTSYRIDGNCADLNLVELQAMLYKYETDFSHLVKTVFNDKFEGNSSEYWDRRANHRLEAVNNLLWNEELGVYFDYDHENAVRSTFLSATSLSPMWSGMCSKEQAEKLVKHALPKLKMKGGVAGCTAESRGEINKNRPQRQWDYPNGWAPHQMMIWKGLLNYNYVAEAEELIYRWLYMITRNAVDYNGTIPEKYDVVEATHKVFAEYGNVGTDFEYITQEGFGWMNASYQYGLSLLSENLIVKLNQLISPETLFGSIDL